MNNWPKVLEFCDQSWNFTNFAPKLYQICTFFATTKKSRFYVESWHFLTFSAKYKIEKRDRHGKSRIGQGKIFFQVYGNPDPGNVYECMIFLKHGLCFLLTVLVYGFVHRVCSRWCCVRRPFDSKWPTPRT